MSPVPPFVRSSGCSAVDQGRLKTEDHHADPQTLSVFSPQPATTNDHTLIKVLIGKYRWRLRPISCVIYDSLVQCPVLFVYHHNGSLVFMCGHPVDTCLRSRPAVRSTLGTPAGMHGAFLLLHSPQIEHTSTPRPRATAVLGTL